MGKRSLYSERKAKGICVICGASMAEPGITRCKQCNDNHNLARKQLERVRLEKGLCKKCGLRSTVDGKNYCWECTIKQQLHSAKDHNKRLSKQFKELQFEFEQLKHLKAEQDQTASPIIGLANKIIDDAEKLRNGEVYVSANNDGTISSITWSLGADHEQT